MKKTVVELFAGVGGFHLGLTRSSDFNIMWANQWEPGKKVQHAFDCYKTHFEDTTICVNEDIAKVKADIPNHTLLCGGFPCQDYSVASTGAKGIEGKKGVLWWEIRDILEDKRPPFVLLENVDRLVKSPASQRGRDFGVMLSSLDDLGYSVEWRIINAAEYGFAQRRRRIFIFAYHKDTKYYSLQNKTTPKDIIKSDGLFAKVFHIEHEFNSNETTLDYNDLVEVSEKFTFNFEASGFMQSGVITTAKTIPVYKQAKTLAEIMEHNVDSKYYLGSDRTKWEYLKGSKSIERTSKTGHKYKFSEGKIAFPDPVDRPARTMLTSESSLNRSTHVVEDLDTKEYRLLTPIECEKLNGFEPNWTNTGMTEKMRYFCMGNALVVGIIEKLGKEISDIIEKE
jgi:DNA (cytosine-5)-methyltransferase 1